MYSITTYVLFSYGYHSIYDIIMDNIYVVFHYILVNFHDLSKVSPLDEPCQPTEKLVRLAWTITSCVMVTMLVVLIRFVHIMRWRNIVSKCLQVFNCLSRNLRTSTVRGEFRNLKITRTKPTKSSNAHARAAAQRTDARKAILNYCASIGRTPYFYQLSNNDQRHGFAGSRSYYWAKDMDVIVQADEIEDHHVLVLIDVDMHIDMNQFIIDHPNNLILMFTITPVAVAEEDSDDASFSFNADNEMKYTVNGGSEFVHRIWNWSKDNLIISGLSSDFIPQPVVVSTLVDHISISKHKSIVLLTTNAHWKGVIGTVMASLSLSGSPLKRLSVVVPGTQFTRLRVKHIGGTRISTSVVDNTLCATIPESLDNALSLQAIERSFDVASVKRCRVDGDEIEHAKSILLKTYFKEMVGRIHDPDMVAETISTGDVYELLTNNDPVKVPIMNPFMNPLLAGAKIPSKGINSEIHSIRDRVEKPKNTMIAKPWMYDRMDEFIKLCLGSDAGKLTPVDIEAVLEKQNKPTQRHIIARAQGYAEAKNNISAFLKAESYGKYGAPRNISTMDPKLKLDYSMIQYSLAAVLKTHPWYAFGKQNGDIAKRVSDICVDVDEVVNTDFAKFDGHVNNIIREFEQKLLVAAFAPEFTDRVIESHKQQQDCKARTSSGVKYNSEKTRGSGSPETSTHNTVVNAFIAYCALRSTRKANGQFKSPQEAFDELGIYGGDDGLSKNIQPSNYIKTAAMFGQVLTLDTAKRPTFQGNPRENEVPVTFLSRVYSPEVWQGDTSSCCSLERTLLKFHLTPARGQMTDEQCTQKLIEKCVAYELTDANTPVIGDFIAKTKEINNDYENQKKELLEESDKNKLTWNAVSSDLDKQYPNQNCSSWMSSQIPEGLNYDTFLEALDECKTMEDLKSLPKCSTPKHVEVTESMVVNGDIVHPRHPGAVTPSDSSDQESIDFTPPTDYELPKRPPVPGKTWEDIADTNGWSPKYGKAAKVKKIAARRRKFMSKTKANQSR